jgi:hypothetical protein
LGGSGQVVARAYLRIKQAVARRELGDGEVRTAAQWSAAERAEKVRKVVVREQKGQLESELVTNGNCCKSSGSHEVGKERAGGKGEGGGVFGAGWLLP